MAPRLGQGTFRVSVTDAYGRACAVTGEHSLPVLEAAHIRDYARDGPHEVRNGILMRADLHRLFDKGYLTISPEHRLEVSSRLRADYANGRSYYPLQGQASNRVPSGSKPGSTGCKYPIYAPYYPIPGPRWPRSARPTSTACA